ASSASPPAASPLKSGVLPLLRQAVRAPRCRPIAPAVRRPHPTWTRPIAGARLSRCRPSPVICPVRPVEIHDPAGPHLERLFAVARHVRKKVIPPARALPDDANRAYDSVVCKFNSQIACWRERLHARDVLSHELTQMPTDLAPSRLLVIERAYHAFWRLESPRAAGPQK